MRRTGAGTSLGVGLGQRRLTRRTTTQSGGRDTGSNGGAGSDREDGAGTGSGGGNGNGNGNGGGGLKSTDSGNGNGAGSVQTGTYGDVDGDGIVSPRDVALTRDYTFRKELGEEERARADVNDDGRVTGADARLIRRYLNGHIDTFPAGKPAPRASAPTSATKGKAEKYWGQLADHYTAFRELEQDDRLSWDIRFAINSLRVQVGSELKFLNLWFAWAGVGRHPFPGTEPASSGRGSTQGLGTARSWERKAVGPISVPKGLWPTMPIPAGGNGRPTANGKGVSKGGGGSRNGGGVTSIRPMSAQSPGPTRAGLLFLVGAGALTGGLVYLAKRRGRSVSP